MTGLIAALSALFVLSLAATVGAYAEARKPTNKVGETLYQLLLVLDIGLLVCLMALSATYAALYRV